MTNCHTDNEREELLRDLVKMAAPLIATISAEEVKELMAFFGIGFVDLPEMAGIDIPEDRFKKILYLEYAAYFEDPESYELTPVLKRVGRLLKLNEKIRLMKTLLQMVGEPLNVKKENIRREDVKDRIECYCNVLGLLWDDATGTFSENLWADR